MKSAAATTAADDDDDGGREGLVLTSAFLKRKGDCVLTWRQSASRDERLHFAASLLECLGRKLEVLTVADNRVYSDRLFSNGRVTHWPNGSLKLNSFDVA